MMRRNINILFERNRTLRSLICPITLDVYVDPVVAADGNTYERKAIEEWFKKSGEAPRSPMTNEPLPNTNLIPNHFVRSIIPDHASLFEEAEEEERQLLLQNPYQRFNEGVTAVKTNTCIDCNGSMKCIKCEGTGELLLANSNKVRCDQCEGACNCTTCEFTHLKTVLNDDKFLKLFTENRPVWIEFISQGIGKIMCFLRRNWRSIPLYALMGLFAILIIYLRHPSRTFIALRNAQLLLRSLFSTIIISIGRHTIKSSLIL